MRKLLVLICLSALLLAAGCSPYPGPPRYSIYHPIAITGNSGEVFVTYQINYGSDNNYKRTSYIQKLGENGEKLWGETGTELSSDRGYYDGFSDLVFAMPVLNDDGSISVICSTKDSIVFHKISADGTLVFSPVTLAAFFGGTSFLKVMSNDSNGAFAAFVSDNNTIGLLHVDSEGVILRRTDIEAPGLEHHKDFGMECDSSGDLVIFGQDGEFRSSTRDEDPPVYCNPVIVNASVRKTFKNRKYELRAQCFDEAGGEVWGEEWVLVSSIPPYWVSGQEPARIIPDGNGGFYVTWAAGKTLKGETASYIQRINSNGERLWGKDGIRLDR